MNGVPAALSASLLWGTADFLAGRATRRHPVMLVAFIGQFAGLVALALILAFHGVDRHALAPGALSGVIGIVGVTALYSALGLGTMSIVAPIGATSAIVPVLWGIGGGERPGPLQWAGIVLALGGVILAAREPSSEGSKDARAAIRLALLAALAIGFSLVFLDKAAAHDSLSGVAAARAVAAPALAAALWWTTARASTVRPDAVVAVGAHPPAVIAEPGTVATFAGTWPGGRTIAALAGIGLLDTAANSAFAIATTGGLLSLVAVLGGLFPVVTVALAYFLLGERLAPPQRAGVVLALIGIPLISAG
ncbi:DMT family transporter [Candidatus Solirubrobacter pratensis]|uniref:DMT family transporter n=1 Tax=Candidatus Solirubrobacter pratensis TaxID=1298857 RepID=UPI000409182B|nr:DMT family transporter [Candidatus Solirubrobacter pratensis]